MSLYDKIVSHSLRMIVIKCRAEKKLHIKNLLHSKSMKYVVKLLQGSSVEGKHDISSSSCHHHKHKTAIKTHPVNPRYTSVHRLITEKRQAV